MHDILDRGEIPKLHEYSIVVAARESQNDKFGANTASVRGRLRWGLQSLIFAGVILGAVSTRWQGENHFQMPQPIEINSTPSAPTITTFFDWVDAPGSNIRNLRVQPSLQTPTTFTPLD